jgi:heat shock protein HslJ
VIGGCGTRALHAVAAARCGKSALHAAAAAALVVLAACSYVTPLPDGPMIGVTWELMELDGQPVGPGANGYRATLRLDDAGRAAGNAGCNRFAGDYSLNGREIRFGEVGMTRMYCEGFMNLEERFSAALRAARGWRIDDGVLELLADGRVLARLARS